MFYYVNQPCTPFFPIGLVQTESDFIVRSVGTDLRRWTLFMLSFFGFLRPNLSPWEYGNGCFPVALCRLIVRRPNFPSAGKNKETEVSPSAGKSNGVVLVPCRAGKRVSTAISGGVDIFEVSGVICYDRWVLNEDHKNYFKDWWLSTHRLSFCFWPFFNSMNYGHITKRV